jgi:hypothetical protein
VEHALLYLAQAILLALALQLGVLAMLATQAQCLQPQSIHSIVAHARQ